MNLPTSTYQGIALDNFILHNRNNTISYLSYTTSGSQTDSFDYDQTIIDTITNSEAIIQSNIDNIAGLDIVRGVDKAYLQSKLNQLGNNLMTVAAGDFSNFECLQKLYPVADVQTSGIGLFLNQDNQFLAR